jgi:hypothetical protein
MSRYTKDWIVEVHLSRLATSNAKRKKIMPIIDTSNGDRKLQAGQQLRRKTSMIKRLDSER